MLPDHGRYCALDEDGVILGRHWCLAHEIGGRMHRGTNRIWRSGTTWIGTAGDVVVAMDERDRV